MRINNMKYLWPFLLTLFVIGCDDRQSVSSENSALFKEKIICLEGASAEVDLWGKNGQSRSCKMKHGVFTGWEDGHKIYEAHYEFGKLVGKAYWFDKAGNITKEINYSKKPNKESK